MKLLFDENLSPKLPHLLEKHFPGSMHVRDCGLKGAADEKVWDYARMHGLTLVSKDADFYQRSFLLTDPPKFIWICVGNCTRNEIFALLIKHEQEIRSLASATEAVLVLS
ncbi:MAG TPA: DUF5615 family PIN-like protein [Methylomirabilota bacterium]|nr:DUF5615 family PIN-like protein [Methylomirabilota bacterium]